PARRMVGVFLTDADLIPRSPQLRLALWEAWLRQAPHTQKRFAHLEWLVAPRLLAANTSWLTTVCGKGWIAVGDAVAAYDPLSSQGMLKAMESGRRAAVAVGQYLAGQHQAWALYQQIAEVMFHQYLLQQRFYYQHETRWQSHAFWQRQQG